jgi:hypothetical protein
LMGLTFAYFAFIFNGLPASSSINPSIVLITAQYVA